MPRRSVQNVEYNLNVVGVDKCDQMRGTYSPQRRSNKPWKVIFTWTLDIACVNAWASWREYPGTKSVETRDRYAFQKALVEELLGISHGGSNETKLIAAKRWASGGSAMSARRRNTGKSTFSDDHVVPQDGNAASDAGNGSGQTSRANSGTPAPGSAIPIGVLDHLKIIPVEGRGRCE